MTEQLLNLRPADTGRPIGELNLGIEVPNLEEQIRSVIATPDTTEQEVRTKDGRTFSLRIRPYRISESRIGGAVVALIDITGQAERQRLDDARIYAESIVDAVRQPLVILDSEFRVVSANPAFYRDFHVTHDQTVGRVLYDLDNQQWDSPRLRALLEEVIPRDAQFDDFEVEHEFPGIGRRKVLLHARRIDQAEGRPQLILLAIEEVTDVPK